MRGVLKEAVFWFGVLIVAVSLSRLCGCEGPPSGSKITPLYHLAVIKTELLDHFDELDDAATVLAQMIDGNGLVPAAKTEKIIRNDALWVTWHQDHFSCPGMCGEDVWGCTDGFSAIDVADDPCLAHTAFLHELTHVILHGVYGDGDPGHSRADFWGAPAEPDNNKPAVIGALNMANTKLTPENCPLPIGGTHALSQKKAWVQ